MKKNLNIALGTLLISSSIFAIYEIKNISKDAINSEVFDNSTTGGQSTNKDEIANNVVAQRLTILGNRCRGCGKCVRIDPEHFEISGRVARVISSTNLNSAALKLAINNCPAGAINLN